MSLSRKEATDSPPAYTGNQPIQTSTFTSPPTIPCKLRKALSPLSSTEPSTSEALEAELKHLRHVFINYNQYPAKLVNKIIKTTLRPTEKQPRQQSAPFIIAIPYIPTISHHIQRLLKQQANIDVVFQKSRSIQNQLRATGKPPKTTKEAPSGVVYHIHCDCGDSYIGETSRPLQSRVKEQQSSVLKRDLKSAISEHIEANPNHKILWHDIKTLEIRLQD